MISFILSFITIGGNAFSWAFILATRNQDFYPIFIHLNINRRTNVWQKHYQNRFSRLLYVEIKIFFVFFTGLIFNVFKILCLVHIFDPKYVLNVNLVKNKVSSLDARAKNLKKHNYKEFISGKWVVKNRWRPQCIFLTHIVVAAVF